ncbi:crosslink repair DNA glycosylase YcaQ family protein [Marinovum sp. 2_MG-2023]|uniref:winged helix-turn-helix domain-containing protein n=1 Tax=unclassified Marinovum TaxID=2647166 RepID=UPI0026E3CE5A|nr:MULTISPECIES: crosslink repair DNA glycosylase YcaQ family protein [unclassified Marinovum]MDO6730204.1 crosslink repair DNA glycosylase YcaQ family protein [Marinovum sp. 2_MG-2023]MDO6778942.1 crosslink repair DNA glycosylase YcaQ family protein [Marinovum sp. 1_MG-2023]
MPPSQNVTRIDNRMARRLFLDKHALGDAPAGAGHGPALQEVITRLGFVQLDSINTVARAHDLILFARRPRYRTGNMERLIEQDRVLFEHWTHDAAVVPMAFYPVWALKRRRDAEILKHRYKEWQRHEFEAEFDRILTMIADSGPVCSNDLGPDTPRPSGGWWNWHPGKTALEYLWRSGRLQICHRQGFRKYYNLSERVVPDDLRNSDWGEAQTIDWFMRGALDRLGFATSGDLAAFWDIVTAKEARDWCIAAEARGEVMPVEVESTDGSLRMHVARPDVIEQARNAPEPTGRMRVLSPFDPALRDRKRAERLFGFQYRIEVFVPEAKRIYGYYVFPLLEGDRIVGRIDMKADRKAGVLNVTALWPERGVKFGAGRQARLCSELERITRLAKVEQLAFADGWLRDTLSP